MCKFVNLFTGIVMIRFAGNHYFPWALVSTGHNVARRAVLCIHVIPWATSIRQLGSLRAERKDQEGDGSDDHER
ncbi:MAG: hypothetical protein E4H01_09295 [Lysobacterales bacterium]|nr:MAG: hypothetical protein E4H01_09295 [Xanthomonadales bacterium]